MSEKENLQKLDCLMREDELLFRLGVTHLISVGYENLTEEAVERTILVIEKEALEEDEDSIPVITPEYQIAILKMAEDSGSSGMDSSEIYLKKGEDIIGLCCSDELHFFFLFFCIFYYVYSLALDVHSVPSLPRLIGSAKTRGKSMVYGIIVNP